MLAWALALSVVLSSLAGCRRQAPLDGTPLYAPFNPRKPIAVVASHSTGGSYEVAVRSLMQGRLALRVESIALVGRGEPQLIDGDLHECVLGGGERTRVAAGVLPASGGDGEANVAVVASAIPIDDPGRSMYREWAWLRRPDEIDAIDAELARLTGMGRCDT